jgi:radical SAM superfamily enzyme YgiQ (UPF0313 family)
LKIRWSAYFIPKRVPLGLLLRLKKAGCIHARWGVETTNRLISDNISKGIGIGEAEKILRQAGRCGIANQISFMVGFPHEKRETTQEIKNFIRKNKQALKVVNIFAFNPRVGSPVYQQPQKYGIKISNNSMGLKEDRVPFDEKDGLSWREKYKQQRLALHALEICLKNLGIPDIDTREYFKSMI